ncbi:hypothetical protein WJX81_007882 [Elliptochloris bilobata]|uniref:Uncharacterized protein n=1 Tax=Elliptochloris bilobata TaxID=381761 RepID=A0AAW1RMI8_9CHLO
MRTFLRTFRRHNQAARILIFIDPGQWGSRTDAFCEYGRHYSAEFFTVKLSGLFPFDLLRFRAYKEVLDALKGAARNVLMVDLRDVLFQSDPFAADALPPSKQAMRPGGELPYVIFTEEGDAAHPLLIENDEYDKLWIENCFNASVYEAVRSKSVVCAGPGWCGQGAIRAHLQLMINVALFTAKEECMQHGVDQAIHNYMAHWLAPRRPDLVAFEVLQLHNDDSPIYTIGTQETPRLDINATGFAVYNQRGRLPPIVHQYDRRKDLLAAIFEIMGDRPYGISY